MTLTWIAVNYVLTVNRAGSLWRTQGQRSVSPTFQSLSQRLHVKRPFCRKAGRLCWRQIHSTKRKGLRGWFCRDSHLRYKLVSPTGISHFSTSACCGSLSLSQRMSRIRSTLDSVSKAVSGTHTDLLSRIARLKPGATQGGKTECPEGKAASAAAKEAPGLEEKKLPPTGGTSQDGGKPNATLTTPGSGAPSGSTITRQTAELFHPSNFAPNLDETYSYLAHHVNTYFGSTPAMDEKQKQSSVAAPKPNPDQIPLLAPVSAKLGSDSAPAAQAPASPSSAPVAPPPATPTAPKKGIGHYLSYPGPSMQAFVGNYLTPLVPKFRSDSRSITAEKDRAPPEDGEVPSQQGEVAEVEEQPVSDDKTRRLLLQREKIIARMSVDNRTRGLVRALQRASDVKIYISRVEELSCHLLEFPETRGVAVKEKVIPCLLRLRQAGDPALQAAVREALALVGYTDPVKGRGIRVLTIDGGGTRGLVALQTLHKLEDLTGKPIYQLFDYICGVSTGAILAFMLGVYQIPLVECEELYRRLGSDVFKQNVIVGTVKMGWSHAFYDSQIWEAILKERMGSDVMIETSRNPKCPKVAAVSTIVNRGTPLKAYVFRNYSMQPGIRSHYLGGCQHQLWQAIRASSAAPGYFQEFVLGSDLHQDGGLLINNPTALAIHECKCLWPNTPVQCVVSLGTGRYEAGSKNSATYTSLKTKLSHVISSATDTEEVHTMLDALLPPDTYFRFNPYMTEDIALDESRKEKLNLLQAEGKRYLERNEEKLRKAAGILTQEKSAIQRLAEWVKLKGDMYDGLPFFSKL